MASVELKNLRKVYPNGFVGLKGADLTFEDGEFVVLVGPSGCGKSTMLRLIAGLEDITSGELWIKERLVNRLAPKDRGIAMVFQNYALYPHLSVRDNLGFGLKHQKTPKDEIDRRVQDVAELLELSEILSRKPKQLSGGQRQRVAVGRAIVRQADVYLFDEPLSNLDASLRVAMRAEIGQLHRRLCKTMIYVTHDQTEAMTMGDRIVVLRDGDVQQVDTPLNLYHHPDNQFVAGFIGSPAMNFISGRVSIDGDNGVFETQDGALKVALPVAWAEQLKASSGREVVLGVRPEHFYEAGTHGLTTFSEVELVVDLLELMGNEVIAYSNLGDQRIVVRDQFPNPPKAGDRVKVAIDLVNLHFFDPETGRSLRRKS